MSYEVYAQVLFSITVHNTEIQQDLVIFIHAIFHNAHDQCLSPRSHQLYYYDTSHILLLSLMIVFLEFLWHQCIRLNTIEDSADTITSLYRL